MRLEIRDITKQFNGVTVLDKASIQFSTGEVHALVGENGAGKSTLIKIIGGTYHADGGHILIDNQEIKIASAQDASKLGISIVFQEYNLVKNMTVFENIMLGREIKGKYGILDNQKARSMIKKIAQNDNIMVDIDKYAGDLGSAEVKITEILRACINNMKFLILDEPSAALDDEDVHTLFKLIENLKSRNAGIIYISHRLEEIFQICDKVSVLKDGKHVGTWDIHEVDQNFIITKMVGRKITDIFPPRQEIFSAPQLLRVKDLSDNKHFFNISFDIREGEILGIGGMSGHGQRELIRSLFGINPISTGEIYVKNRIIRIRSPRDAMKQGFAFLSDDRRNEGLAPDQSVLMNIAYPTLGERSSFGFIKTRKNSNIVDDLIRRLNIKLNSPKQITKGLSGGNQQRVVLAKWLPMNPRLMLFHEPTLGVDVGAKMEIYAILRELTRQSISILMVTSDMMELLGMSDRILVFYEGKISALIPGDLATEELIMAGATGHYNGVQ
jgi:ribose transport system ATP-binding protein